MGQGRLLKKGQRLTIPANNRGPILVFVGEKGATYRFRGVVHSPQPDKCVTYSKQNAAVEEVEMLRGSAEFQF